MEVKQAFVDNMGGILGVVIVVVNVVMFAYTRSLVLAFLAGVMSCVVYLLQLFFVCAIMGVSVGPLEVTALTCFIGYAASLPMLIVQRYGATQQLLEVGGIDP